MKKQKTTKRAFISSLISLALCVTMLVGTTFAWYTDSVTSGRNTIVAGSLDMVIERYNGNASDAAFADNWQNVDGTTKIFNETDGKLTFEPGAVQVAYVRVKNNGDLAFKYSLAAKVYEEKAGTNQDNQSFLLSDYLKFGTATVTEPFANREAAIGAVSANATKLQDATLSVNGAYLAKGADPVIVALVVYMPSDVGNVANPKPGDAYKPTISFGLNALATQATIENDSFSNTYDGAATIPTAMGTATVPSAGDTVITAGSNTATVPDGSTNADPGDKLTLTVTPGTQDSTLVISDGNNATTYDVSLINQDGEKVTNSSEGIKIVLDIGVVDLQAFYHNAAALTKVDSLDAVALNKYYYDVAAGKLTFITDSFSPFTAEYFFDGGLGTEAYPYLIASTDSWNAMYPAVINLTSAKYFALSKDVDFTGKTINNSTNNSQQYMKNLVLDGKGYAVKGISDFTGYKQLFPYISDSSIKNLDIEYNLDTNKTVATAYNANNVIFENVDVKGIMKTKADWASAFVAYPYGSGTISYINCNNYAKLQTNLTSNSYVAPFGSHTMSIGGITLENCANYGEIIGGNASAFIGMTGGNTARYTVSGLTNYGKVKYALNGNTFTYGSSTLNAKVTAATGSSVEKLVVPELNIAIENGKLVIKDVDASENYDVTMSVSVQMYNYNNSGNWSGGFPRTLTKRYSGADAVNGEIVTDFVNAPVLESPCARTGYGKDGANVTYHGIFVPADFNLSNANILLQDDNGVVKLLSYEGKTFYYMNDSEWPEWYSLVTTGNGAESGTLKGTITVTFNVEAELNGKSVSYTFSIPEAAAIFGA